MEIKILVVEDNPIVQKIIVNVIKQMVGKDAAIEFTSRADDALNRFKKAHESNNPFDIVVTDNELHLGPDPKGSSIDALGGDHGLALIKAIREYEEQNNVTHKCILSMHSGNSLNKEAIELGANRFISKTGGPNGNANLKGIKEAIRSDMESLEQRNNISIDKTPVEKGERETGNDISEYVPAKLKREGSNPKIQIAKRIKESLPTPDGTPTDEIPDPLSVKTNIPSKDISDSVKDSFLVSPPPSPKDERNNNKVIPNGVSDLEDSRIQKELKALGVKGSYKLDRTPSYAFTGKFIIEGDEPHTKLVAAYFKDKNFGDVTIYRLSGDRAKQVQMSNEGTITVGKAQSQSLDGLSVNSGKSGR